jgi:hypothetical protein
MYESVHPCEHGGRLQEKVSFKLLKYWSFGALE